MSAFDKVIGYEPVKKELIQIVDMVNNPDVYKKVGARVPNGLLIYGAPGLGKTLLCNCFIKETNLKTYYIKRDRDKDFIESISNTFCSAKENAPSIVFCDDIDKIGNPDGKCEDAPEFAAIQAGIDSVKDRGVFVLATVNKLNKLPKSLIRAGRFDRKIELFSPSDEDAERIIKHYLSDKKIADDVNFTDLAKMMSYSNCADLECLLNEAAITAAYERRESIEMADFVDAVLKTEYGVSDNFKKNAEEDIKKTALHEAGHIVVSECLTAESVGLASIQMGSVSSLGGFMHLCKNPNRKTYCILTALAGKVAVEMYYADVCASGC